MQKKVLIVDDDEINRQVLVHMLRDTYILLEARDGREALDCLLKERDGVSAVLLDLIMPVMDGYETLRCIRSEPALALIPVIVTTGSTGVGVEVQALALGANDFITKPYHPEVIRHRLANTIRFQETAAVLNSARRDRLTGLLNREAFYERAAELIAAAPPGSYVLSCLDIDRYKIINDQYGLAKGDEVLRHIARELQEGIAPVNGLACRVSADNFALLYPASLRDGEALAGMMQRAAAPAGLLRPLTFSVGRYLVENPADSVSTMYDRASLAKRTVKGRYDVHVADYDVAMRTRLLREQRIVTEMREALEERRFEVWYQPQYNYATGSMVGAEALVRWRTGDGSLISPGDFIPVFERNGFVYEVDKFVWEETCRMLRRWMDEGRALIPVSVNVSRYDIFREDFLQAVTGLVEKYKIPVHLLQLEITESAFTRSTDQIVQKVRQLIDYGFTVEIDDFGSGYSSLNTLKAVPATVLKLDMRFLEETGHARRGGNILESVVRMAKWLGMSVIAEGVERREQADFLNSIGCGHMQGFLFSRPLPLAAFESCAQDAAKGPADQTLETVAAMDNNAFWDPDSMETLIFNSYVGGACIFEVHEGKPELLRVNDKYADIIGGMTAEQALALPWPDRLAPESRAVMNDAVRRSIDSGREVECEVVFHGGVDGSRRLDLRIALRVIARAGDRCLIYATVDDMTARREAERKEQAASRQLHRLMNDTPGGFVRIQLLPGRKAGMVYANDGFCRLLGMSREVLLSRYGTDAGLALHPEDRAAVGSAIDAVAPGGYFRVRCRMRTGSGGYIWLLVLGRMVEEDGGVRYLNVYYADASEQDKLEAQRQALLGNLPCGAGVYVYDGSRVTAQYVNARQTELTGLTLEELSGRSALELIHPDDRERLLQELETALREGTDRTCETRIRVRKGGYQRFRLAGSAYRQPEGTALLYISFIPISPAEASYREMLSVALQATMADSNDILFVKDRDLTYLCGSRALARSAGLADETALAGKTDFDLVDEALARRYRESDREIMRSGKPLLNTTVRLPERDGERRYLVTSKYPLYDADGAIIGIYGIGRDVTENRTAYRRLKLLADDIPGGLASYYVAGDSLRQVYSNDGFYRLMGCSRTAYEAQAAEPLHFVHPEDQDALRAFLLGLAGGETGGECTCRFLVSDGSQKWLSIRGAVAERSREGVMVNVVLYDITALKETEERLRRSEEEITLALSQIGKMICLYDKTTHTLTVPAAYAQKHGTDTVLRDLPERLEASSVFSEESRGQLAAFCRAMDGDTASGSIDVHVRCADGSDCWEQYAFAQLQDGAGKSHKVLISVEDVTNAHKARDEAASLREYAEIFRTVTAHSNRAVFLYDIATKTSYASTPEREEIIGTVFHNIPEADIAGGHILPESVAEYRQVFQDIRAGKSGGRARIHMLNDAGIARWFEMCYSLIYTEDGKPKSAVISYLNITADHEKELAYHRYQQTIRQESATDGSLIYLESDVTADVIEKRGGRLLPPDLPAEGTSRTETIRYIVRTYIVEAQRAACASFFSRATLITSFSDGVRSASEDWAILLPDGRQGYIRSELQMVQDPFSGHIKAYTVLRDVTEEIRAVQEIRKQAELDGLTGVYNKTTTELLVRQRLEHTTHAGCALLVVDIDNLKTLNDTLGHPQGDRAIRAVGTALQAQFRSTDIVGRIGGDEFLAFLDGFGDEPRLHSAVSALVDRMSGLRVGEENDTPVSASVGVAAALVRDTSFQQLYRQADRALYQAKRAGKRQSAFYTPEMA